MQAIQIIKKSLAVALILSAFTSVAGNAWYRYNYHTTHCWNGYCHRVSTHYWGGNGYRYHTRWVNNYYR